MVAGSCLCGKVRYEINGNIGDVVHCHCITCRKAHGAAFSSVAAVKVGDFTVLGDEHLSQFESSPGKIRHFCSHCGTQIYAKRKTAQHIVLRLGSLDESMDDSMEGSLQLKEKNHIWVSQKASWYSIDSHLPQCLEFE